MRNINHRNAAGSEGSDYFQKTNYFVLIERGRRLVHDDNPRLDRKGSGDLDELLLANRKFTDHGPWIDIQVQRMQNLSRIPAHPLPIDDWSKSRLAGNKYILGHA